MQFLPGTVSHRRSKYSILPFSCKSGCNILICLQGCTFCSLAAEKHAGLCLPHNETCPTLPESLDVEKSCPSPYLPLVISGVVLYLAAFSPGLGPVPWSVNAEIFPLEVHSIIHGQSFLLRNDFLHREQSVTGQAL